MSLSKLKLNPEKTEFIVFGSKAQRQKISSHFPVSILGSLLHLVDSVRNLGVWFDADFPFSEHVKMTCKACFLQMCDLHRIFIYLGFYIAFNTVQVISRRVVGRAEETSTYSSLGFCIVNCRPTASNYQLSHLRPCRGSNPGLRGGRRAS